VTAIFDLTPLIMPFVRDCATPAAIVAARFACIEFYKNTLWQQEELEPIDLVAGQATYPVDTMPNTVPSAVMRVKIDGIAKPLEFVTKDKLDQLYRYTDWTTLVGNPRYVTQIVTDQIILVPAPDDVIAQPKAMKLLVATQPTPDADEIDDEVFNYYAEPLAYGARARLYETAGQPYYDPASAPFCWTKFYAGVSEAKARRMREHTRAVQTVQMRPWV
jgi:hypothetical protein